MEIFINQCVDSGDMVRIITTNGFQLRAVILINALEHIVVDYNGDEAMIYKHAISTIIR